MNLDLLRTITYAAKKIYGRVRGTCLSVIGNNVAYFILIRIPRDKCIGVINLSKYLLTTYSFLINI